MKKKIIVIFCILFCLSCTTYNQDLERMGQAVKSHFKYRDQENGTITKLSLVEPISYVEVPENQRENPDEAYLFKVYVRGTWKYPESFRVYNIDDTLKCYFSTKKVFLRIDNTNNK